MTIFNSTAEDGEQLTVSEFNELTAFMSRFDERIESKHSFGTDNTLGRKVKVTILASGFGLEEAPDDEDIYGEEMYRLTQGERLQILYEYFYGRISRSQRKWNTFVFLNDELDKDDVISDIETSPTYKRTSRFVGNIRMNRNKT